MNNVEYLRAQSKRRITLNDYVRAYYDAEIVPYDYSLNEIILKAIERTFELTEEAYRNPTHPCYYDESKRINEYGNHVENVLCRALQEITGNEAKNLGVGYPDVRTSISTHIIYPECKITQDIDEIGSMRMFYTTTPAERTKKIKNLQDGMHLLFKFEHDGPSRLTGRYKMYDLNGLQYTAEGSLQQGNDKDLNETAILVFSQ